MLRTRPFFPSAFTSLVLLAACSSEPQSNSDMEPLGPTGPVTMPTTPGATTSDSAGGGNTGAGNAGATAGVGGSNPPPAGDTGPGSTGGTPGGTGTTPIANGPGPTPSSTGTDSAASGAGGTASESNPPINQGGAGATPPENPDNGGAGGAGGMPGQMEPMGPDVDQNGKANAAPGEMTSTPQDYLRLGEIRILNNNWGSEELGCNAPMSVFVNQDSTFGWNFNRGDCDSQGTNASPDFPQIEFGIHPFGIGDSRVTSPEFSSTTLLPLQIKDIQSASVTVDNLTANLQRDSSWNITFEFWLSERDPVNDPNPGVYAELMTFWGWQSGRWPEPPNGMGPTGNGAGAQVSSGAKTYTLWVQDDAWANGQWRYFQFRADDGPQRNFSGTIDVKAFLDYLVNSRQYSGELWVTRLEVGSEIDDETQGTVQMSGITFEVNGESRSAIIGGN